MQRCPYGDFLAALEYVDEIGQPIFEQAIWPHRQTFLDRGWIKVAGYSDGQTIEGDDGWVAEVRHNINVAGNTYSYANPNWPGQIVVRPLWEIAHYTLCVSKFLDQLTDLIGIEPTRREVKAELVAGHLWQLGAVRIQETARWAKVCVARRAHASGDALIKAALDDEIAPGHGIMLVDQVSRPKAFGTQIERCLADLLDYDGHQTTFRHDKLQRVLMRFAEIEQESGPAEYLEGTKLKLAHFTHPMNLSAALTRIVKQCWGSPEKQPPVVTWIEINGSAKTGYASFDNAFGDDKKARALIFTFVSRGRYQLRRAESQKLQRKLQKKL